MPKKNCNTSNGSCLYYNNYFNNTYIPFSHAMMRMTRSFSAYYCNFTSITFSLPLILYPPHTPSIQLGGSVVDSFNMLPLLRKRVSLIFSTLRARSLDYKEMLTQEVTGTLL